jgi:hypothetical protein
MGDIDGEQPKTGGEMNDTTVKHCKCGCGTEVKADSKGKWTTWSKGHYLKGKHGFGRMARDSVNHHEAKHWIIRDNRGVIHECDNLQSWCRANEWRFLPDARPESKAPLSKRAFVGIAQLGCVNGKACSWNGWTLVSVVERQEQGAPDLMDREELNHNHKQPVPAGIPKGDSGNVSR